MVTNFKIVEFHDYICNQYEKCFQISTNMSGIGSLIREIDVNISGMSERKQTFFLSKINARVLSLN